jgi:hypothetical protein
MAYSNALIQQLLDHAFNQATMTQLVTVYAALFTTAPDANGAGGTEVSGGSYARVAITASTGFDRTAQTLNNTAEITFPTSSASWGNCTHFGLYTASSGGTFLGFSALTTPRDINAAGITPKFPVSGMQIAMV